MHELTARTGNLTATGLGLAKPAMVGLALVLAVAGCTRTNLNQGGLPPQQATPLKPAPLEPVDEAKLEPVEPVAPKQVEPKPEVPEEVTEVAKADPSQGAQPVTRQAMVGAWTVSTGGSSCQIFLALTKWSGGYRAASRGCSAAAISDVQAWDVKGKQVVLVDSSGNTAASLFRSADERFDGSTTGGGAISFSR